MNNPFEKQRAESDAKLIERGAEVDETGSLNPTAKQKLEAHKDMTTAQFIDPFIRANNDHNEKHRKMERYAEVYEKLNSLISYLSAVPFIDKEGLLNGSRMISKAIKHGEDQAKDVWFESVKERDRLQERRESLKQESETRTADYSKHIEKAIDGDEKKEDKS